MPSDGNKKLVNQGLEEKNRMEYKERLESGIWTKFDVVDEPINWLTE